ncbi:MAG TPA: ATPase domain-containing protein [Methanothrix sp.]|nr:ATPase domain-containing protein [Methanothrix sp.]
MSIIERISTGISGLDDMIEGGLPVPSLVLVSGDAGAGKTSFCTQFLFKGASLGEPGLYFLTFGWHPEWIFEFSSGYEFAKREYLGKRIRVVELQSQIEKAAHREAIHEDVQENILEAIRYEIKGAQPKRIVLENLSVLKDVLRDDFRRFLLNLSSLVKEQMIVALVTGEALPGAPYPVEIAHAADGIILLQNAEVNLVRKRSIEILKMCATSHPLGKHSLDISARGLTVYPGM